MTAKELADVAPRMWPGLVIDCVGQLVRQGGDYVVFSFPRRGLQFRADSLADCERYLGPPQNLGEAQAATEQLKQRRKAPRVVLRQTTIFDKKQTTLF